MARATQTQAQIAALFEKSILKLLEQGGRYVLDGEGNRVLIDLTAADHNAINNFLKSKQISSSPIMGAADSLEAEAERRGVAMKFKGRKVRPIDTDQNDAATA